LIVAGIPAYNEEKTIAKVILLAQKYADTVVVCDDGSQDMTTDIAQKLGAVVIRHSENMGYGYALQSLFKKANALNADILLTLDADGQHDAREIPVLTQPILEDKADVVIGSRFLNERKGIPSYRRLGIKLLTRFTKSGGKNHISDAQCGFRAYNRRALESITLYEEGMGASAEILMKAGDEGLRVVEVPVQVHYRNLDTSTHNPLRHGLSVLSTIIKLIVEESPLVYLGIPGLGLLTIGVFFGLWTLQIYATSDPHRIVTNLALATVFFGLSGIFALFTAITLYAIARLVKKTTSQ
jgi:glycosyltransferase involved in cell wall biosynthesis